MSIPPKLGIAIGIIISLPLPVLVKMGSKAKMVVAVVIKHGRILRSPASMTLARISCTSLGALPLKDWVR